MALRAEETLHSFKPRLRYSHSAPGGLVAQTVDEHKNSCCPAYLTRRDSRPLEPHVPDVLPISKADDILRALALPSLASMLDHLRHHRQ